jgi:hypothetical protein
VGQLEATGVFGTATFTQSSGDPDLVVDGNGAISAPDTLPTGDYSASGTDTDGFNNGSWSFTLDVVDPKPTVSSVNPSSGTLNGGQSITIDGTGFVLGAQVHIAQGHGPSVSGGAVVATNVVVVSSDVITATTPAATLAGSFNLFVVTPGGISAPTAGDLYRYKDPVPTVSGISPTSGSVSGGQPITITGTGFVSGAKVEIGRGGGPGPTAARATNVDVVSSTEITATTGATSVAGSGYVFVQTPGGISVHNTGAKYKYS